MLACFIFCIIFRLQPLDPGQEIWEGALYRHLSISLAMGKNKCGWSESKGGWVNSKNKAAGSGTVTDARRKKYQEKCRKRDEKAALAKRAEGSSGSSLDKSGGSSLEKSGGSSLDESGGSSLDNSDSLDVKGFEWPDLNGSYRIDRSLCIGGKPTYWDTDRRCFFYY